MKNMILVLMVMIGVVFLLNAQSSPSLGITSATVASGCLSPSGAAVSLCTVPGDGLYVAVGSGAFQKVNSGSISTGATDYSQLTGKPTKISCTTSSQSNSGFTASGCTIN